MKELDPRVMLAIMQEMLGPLLWLLVGVAIVGLVAFIALLLRERRLDARRVVVSQLVGLFGGALALVLMARVSSSGFTDAGGPIDWILIALVFGAGLLGTAILAYTAMGFCPRCRRGRCGPAAPRAGRENARGPIGT